MIPSILLSRFLSAMEYPAEKNDLIREAGREGLDATDIALLESLEDRSYDSPWQIRVALARPERLRSRAGQLSAA